MEKYTMGVYLNLKLSSLMLMACLLAGHMSKRAHSNGFTKATCHRDALPSFPSTTADSPVPFMSHNEKSQPPLNGAATTPSVGDELPSYEQLRAERNLKESFARVVQDQQEIQKLFTSVAAKLETTPNIGEGHALCTEWDGLRRVGKEMME